MSLCITCESAPATVGDECPYCVLSAVECEIDQHAGDVAKLRREARAIHAQLETSVAREDRAREQFAALRRLHPEAAARLDAEIARRPTERPKCCECGRMVEYCACWLRALNGARS